MSERYVVRSLHGWPIQADGSEAWQSGTTWMVLDSAVCFREIYVGVGRNGRTAAETTARILNEGDFEDYDRYRRLRVSRKLSARRKQARRAQNGSRR